MEARLRVEGSERSQLMLRVSQLEHALAQQRRERRELEERAERLTAGIEMCGASSAADVEACNAQS